MNRENFDQLVRGIEKNAGSQPGWLYRRTVVFALLGYAVLLSWFFAVLLVALVFLSGLFWAEQEGKIACGVLGVLVLTLGGWLSLRVLLVRLEPPRGRRLERTEAPKLFAVLDDLGRQLETAPFHCVLLTPQFNAAVVQMPRLGVLGWPRNYLLLGLPLLDALSPDEMRAVLAHEFAHLSRKHGQQSHWLYLLRRSWEKIYQEFAVTPPARASSFRPVVMKFVDWFWPRFNAHAFVLSRRQEYEADAQGRQLAGAPAMAASLVRLHVLSAQLDEVFWPRLWRQAQTAATPPNDVFLQLRNDLRQGGESTQVARWTREAFQSTSTNSDTHPCLRERLAALQVPHSIGDGVTTAARPSAAEILLGANLDRFRRDVQRDWQEFIAPQWTAQHARSGALTHRLNAIDQTAPADAAAVETLWDRAGVLLDLNQKTSAAPLLRQILDREADHAVANYQLGRLLLESGDDSGVAHLERAMAANEEFVPAAGVLLHDHYQRLGRREELGALAARLDRHEVESAASREERVSVSARDEFLPHGLTAAELTSLRAALAAQPEIESADLAQKKLRYLVRQRLFVLCIRRRWQWRALFDTDRDRELARRVQQSIKLPGRSLVVPASGGFRALARKIHRTGAKVWPAS